jgi:hypothetical protein
MSFNSGPRQKHGFRMVSEKVSELVSSWDMSVDVWQREKHCFRTGFRLKHDFQCWSKTEATWKVSGAVSEKVSGLEA